MDVLAPRYLTWSSLLAVAAFAGFKGCDNQAKRTFCRKTPILLTLALHRKPKPFSSDAWAFFVPV